jgi:predicted dehydrogenase
VKNKKKLYFRENFLKMKKYKWGVIGPGRIAHKFLNDLKRLPNVELYAVAGRDKQRANDFATQHAIPHAFGNPSEMLEKCPDLDVVYVATPHVGHLAATLLCLEKGVAVLCEKPLGMNAQEVATMIECAQKHNTFFMEAMWSRFLPTIRKMLEIIELGEIGAVKTVQADFGFYTNFNPKSRLFDKKLGGGSLLDVGIYPVFLSYLLLGNPTEIIAKATFTSTEVDETCAAILTYGKHKLAMIHSSVSEKTPTEGFIYGEKGMIHLHGRFHEPNAGFTLKVYDNYEKFFPFNWESGGYDYQAAEVMQCLNEGKIQSTLWSWQNSYDVISILDSIRKEIGLEY